jgi:hypothetical protein
MNIHEYTSIYIYYIHIYIYEYAYMENCPVMFSIFRNGDPPINSHKIPMYKYMCILYEHI